MADEPAGDCRHADVPRPQASAHHVECSTRDASHARFSRAGSGQASPWRQPDRSPLAGALDDREGQRPSRHRGRTLLQPAPVSSKPSCAGFQPARAPSRGHSKPLRTALSAKALSRRHPKRPKPLSSRALRGICWLRIPRRPLLLTDTGSPGHRPSGASQLRLLPRFGTRVGLPLSPTHRRVRPHRPTSPAGALRLSPCADLPTNPLTGIIGA